MSSSAEVKIAAYEARIKEHLAEIKQIKASEGFNRLAEPYISLIKSENDAIHDCEAAILILRQHQQQQQGNCYCAYACFAFC